MAESANTGPVSNPQAESRPALFLDRDGVLIEELEYLSDPGRVRLIPGAAAAVRRANDAGWRVAVVSNQSGVARGLFPENVLPLIHGVIAERLADEAGAVIDQFYYCPHHPTAGLGIYRTECECRKPKPGMMVLAARELSINLAKSWMVGDRMTDLQAGAAAGCRTILVRTGYGLSSGIVAPDPSIGLAAIVPSIVEAVDFALLNSKSRIATPV